MQAVPQGHDHPALPSVLPERAVSVEVVYQPGAKKLAIILDNVARDGAATMLFAAYNKLIHEEESDGIAGN
jgi:hypothetical protein